MKFHWGHGIVLAALAFVSFISALVYRSMQEKVDFVTSDYYEKELVYQDRIDSEHNARMLRENLVVEYSGDADLLEFRFPAELAPDVLSGEIAFYRPDNSSLDFSVPVRCRENHRQQVSSVRMKPGLWKVMVNWKGGNTPYYFEKKIMVN